MSKLTESGFLAGVDQLLKNARAQHGVGTKRASEETSHPSGSKDNGTMPVSTGARYAENSAAIKEQYPGISVEGEQGILADGPADQAQFDIGITSTTTGNDPENERNYQGNTPDPGTTHPADVSNNEKYGSLSLRKGIEVCTRLGQELLADVNTAMHRKAAEAKAKQPQQSQPAAKPAAAPDAMTKAAAENKQLILEMVKAGELAADLTYSYILEKYAEEEAEEVEDAGSEEPTADDSQEAPMPEGDEGAGADMGDVPGGDEALQAMLGGGGGMSPDAAAAGGDPTMGGGDPMAGGDPMMGGGDGGDIEQLLASIPPEALIEAISQVLAEQGQEPEALGKLGHVKGADHWAAAGKSVQAYRKSGKFRMRAPRNAKEAAIREFVHATISELLPTGVN